MFFKVEKVDAPKDGEAYVKIVPSLDHFIIYLVNGENEPYMLDTSSLNEGLSLASSMKIPVKFGYDE